MNELNAAHYLPHRTPMVLLDSLVAAESSTVHCRVSTATGGVMTPFLAADGTVPAWFGIEMMAQAIGVWSGWHARQQGITTLLPGMLLGGRSWRASVSHFPANAVLDIQLHLVMADGRIGSFEGEILHHGAVLAEGRLNTFQPSETELQQMQNGVNP